MIQSNKVHTDLHSDLLKYNAPISLVLTPYLLIYSLEKMFTHYANPREKIATTSMTCRSHLAKISKIYTYHSFGKNSLQKIFIGSLKIKCTKVSYHR